MAGANGSALGVFAAPPRYVQGEGALDALGDEIARLRSVRPLVLCDPHVRADLGPRLEAVAGATVVEFNGEASANEVERVAALVREVAADGVVGVGGGKTLDTAKAVAHPAGLPLVVVPTIASTDAPTSSLALIYEDDGRFKEFRVYGRNPDTVLVDTAVIARAPVRFLVAGIGDGLSTWFEADASARAGKHALAGGPPLLAATALARLCYDTLLADGVAAREAVERGEVTPALERVVEANTLLSGLGFESGGLAAAHSIHNGLTALPETHHRWHGEKVAFGVLALLVLEQRDRAEIDEVVDFCLRVGLPVTLGDLGLRVDPDVLAQVAAVACAEGETIHNEPFPVTTDMVVAALETADALGAQRRERLASTTSLPAVCA
jgi:glycerol dehydrogenase